MNKIFAAFLVLAVCTTSVAQESRTGGVNRRGEAAGFASRDATVLSMMGWGIALTVGIATLFSLLDNNSTSGGGGNGNHTH